MKANVSPAGDVSCIGHEWRKRDEVQSLFDGFAGIGFLGECSPSATNAGSGEPGGCEARGPLDEAEKNNPQIQATRHAWQSAKQVPVQVATLPDPQDRLAAGECGKSAPFCGVHEQRLRISRAGLLAGFALPGESCGFAVKLRKMMLPWPSRNMSPSGARLRLP